MAEAGKQLLEDGDNVDQNYADDNGGDHDNGDRIELTENAVNHFAQKGFDPIYGARPLKRVMQKDLETAIGYGILKGDISEGASVIIDYRDGQLDLSIVSEASTNTEA